MLKEQRKYQMKSHPWLYRFLWVSFIVNVGLLIYKLYQEQWVDSSYLGVLCAVLFGALLFCSSHNRQVVRQREIHHVDLQREIYHYQHFE